MKIEVSHKMVSMKELRLRKSENFYWETFIVLVRHAQTEVNYFSLKYRKYKTTHLNDWMLR